MPPDLLSTTLIALTVAAYNLSLRTILVTSRDIPLLCSDLHSLPGLTFPLLTFMQVLL